MFRYSVEKNIPKVFFSKRAFLSEATLEDVINKIFDDGGVRGLGFSTFFAANSSAALKTGAGWGMADYNFMQVLRLEVGTEVIVSNFNNEREVTIIQRSHVTVLETKPIFGKK